MRISIRLDDPGYSARAFLYRVLLDGEELFNCFTADEEQGVVFCYEEDDAGRGIVDLESFELKETERHGKVEIIPPVKST
ncbi:MAG: hypothetical protein JRJ45_00430 [Deltaproteobacteria bacterium]|nr:hypothetical protein [Deltaproteobacteria bacterium]